MIHHLCASLERVLKPATFCYDFKHPRAGLSYVASRLWILSWLLVDAGVQLVLESDATRSTSTLLGVGIWLGTAGTFVLLWKLPVILGATLAGLGIFRAAASLSVMLSAHALSSAVYTPILILVVQGWMLSAYAVLVLRYVRTPKKDVPEVRWPRNMKQSGGAVLRPWWG